MQATMSDNVSSISKIDLLSRLLMVLGKFCDAAGSYILQTDMLDGTKIIVSGRPESPTSQEFVKLVVSVSNRGHRSHAFKEVFHYRRSDKTSFDEMRNPELMHLKNLIH